MDDDKAGMYVKPPSGSYVSWENTMCNPLGDMRTQTHSAWHDGYASAKAECEWVGLTPEDKRIAGVPLFTEQISMSEAFDVIEKILKEKNS